MAAENSTEVKSRQRRRVVYGAVLNTVLLVVALLIFFLDDLLKATRSEYDIFVVTPGAAGLVAGSPVWVNGREVGTVTSVSLLPVGADALPRILLAIELPTHVRSQVRADSEVRITSVSVISKRVVDIRSGTAAARALAPADTLRQSLEQLSPAQLTARAAAVKQELDSVLAELRTHAPAMRARLAQTELAFAGIDATVLEVARLQVQLDESPAFALLRDPAFAAALSNTRAHAAQLPVMIATLRERAGAASDVSLALARLQARADSLRAQLDIANAALANPNGTLARMQQDSALTRAIHAARAELDSLMADVRRNPLRYVF